MKAFPVPVVGVGPGSQPEDESFSYLTMPSDMQVYTAPPLPEPEEIASTPQAKAVLQQIAQWLQRCGQGGSGGTVDLTGLPPADLRMLNQILAEGEVSAVASPDTDDGQPLRIQVQESVFAGVWRILTEHNGALASDRIEVAPVPTLFHDMATLAVWPQPPQWEGALPGGVMNAPALIEEIRDHSLHWRAGDAPHVVNLSLLPVSPEDISFLDHHLGTGPLLVLSRGYGNCRIISTRTAHCWRLVYYNSAESVLLNAVEITDMPDAIKAAPEDMLDAHARLADILTLVHAD